ncbi:UDP-GlcNAc:undecaprenyl-phosphate GlcNAc-1-phosphate transferase [Povalibacter uvarum]|uniref:UDP-GlcNAc:undecaprenyl-phosphate GlcNAc-1-phosphate transferase n=1 Tax=Povalibacter uvarum TaxID=732238 RepID=A0A841HET1_9GAMM|nr:MraY family glycosyltransferase [Povalibacter uvarum]MBB6091266.1 UDP-GlcNAc:undecaprenyl-phosphate GlcNAc-1-phosphate transferase [Povalibacter uvarum]
MDLILGFVLAMSVTMALIPPLMQLAVRFNVLDAPGERKVHSTPVPRVGGIAMCAATLLTLLLSGEFAQPMPAFLAGITVLLLFGVWDDRVTLSATPKLVGQAIAVLVVMVGGDVSIATLTFDERYTLPSWVAQPLTFVFLLGVTNAINLADGLDGLAGGTTLLSLSALALLALTSGNPFVGGVAIAIIGAILGFLRYNTHPARVFMGDGGSQILGFSAGVLAVVLTQDATAPLSAALPLLILGVPIIDTLMVMTQRILEGRSPFHADRNHIHHRLLALGFDHHEAVMTIYALQSAFFLIAWCLRYESDVTIVITFAACSLTTIGLLQWASSTRWRLRAALGDRTSPVSPLGRALRWLRQPQHLQRWVLTVIALAISLYLLNVSVVVPAPSPDVRIMSILLAIVIGASLALRWRAPEASLIDKLALYIAVVIAVYFDRDTSTWLDRVESMDWLLFGSLALAIVIRFRLASDRRFRVTPLDLLVIFIAITIPNLPGSIASGAGFGADIAKLLLLMYGIETLLAAAPREWRLPSIVALAFLAVCTLRGLI